MIELLSQEEKEKLRTELRNKVVQHKSFKRERSCGIYYFTLDYNPESLISAIEDLLRFDEKEIEFVLEVKKDLDDQEIRTLFVSLEKSGNVKLIKLLFPKPKQNRWFDKFFSFKINKKVK